MKHFLIITLSLVSFSFYAQDDGWGMQSNKFLQAGDSKYAAGDYKGAVADYTKSIESYPNTTAYYRRANAEAKLEDYLSAIKDYNRAIRNNRGFIKAYIARGIAKNNIADKKGACLDWAKAVELGDEEGKALIKQYCK